MTELQLTRKDKEFILDLLRMEIETGEPREPEEALKIAKKIAKSDPQTIKNLVEIYSKMDRNGLSDELCENVLEIFRSMLQ